MPRKVLRARIQALRQAKKGNSTLRPVVDRQTASKSNGTITAPRVIQSDGSTIACDPHARVIRIGKDAGFFKRAFYITKESLLHPRTTSYILFENPQEQP